MSEMKWRSFCSCKKIKDSLKRQGMWKSWVSMRNVWQKD